MPDTAKKVMALLKDGHTLSATARELGIPFLEAARLYRAYCY